MTNLATLTIRDAAELASITTQRIGALIKAGTLSIISDEPKRIDRAEFEAWMANRRNGAHTRKETSCSI